jgi:hypothetical protein
MMSMKQWERQERIKEANEAFGEHRDSCKGCQPCMGEPYALCLEGEELWKAIELAKED